MIKQIIDVESYWKVIVFYSMDYNFFDTVAWELRMYGISNGAIEDVWESMSSGSAKAVTCNNTRSHVSIVIFNTHSSEADYINSIVHEAEHVKQAMLKAYEVEDRGEPSAYTVGFLVMKMYEVFRKLIQ